MSLRSPLGRVLGFGAAKQGVGHWWVVRVTAVALIPLTLVVAFLKSPLFKGWFGEKRVSAEASRRLPPEQYRAFHNVTLPDGTGTTQVDHIYVSRFGVFVVETKNMAGWIFGDAKQRQWTQTIYRKKTRFQNPIHQNYKHLKTLEALLHVGLAQGPDDFRVELGDDRLRCSGARVKPVPIFGDDRGKAQFRNRGKVRHYGRALRSGDRERAHAVRLDVRG